MSVLKCWHCSKRTAGFWVRLQASETTRRPWCILCIDGQDLREAGIYEIVSIERAEAEGSPA